MESKNPTDTDEPNPEERRLLNSQTAIDILFDGPPAHESGRFVETEHNGKGIKLGEWFARPDGLWSLRFDIASVLAAIASVEPPPNAYTFGNALHEIIVANAPNIDETDTKWLRDRARCDGFKFEVHCKACDWVGGTNYEDVYQFCPGCRGDTLSPYVKQPTEPEDAGDYLRRSMRGIKEHGDAPDPTKAPKPLPHAYLRTGIDDKTCMQCGKPEDHRLHDLARGMTVNPGDSK